MKLFRFDKEVGTHISRYESDFRLSRILRTENANLQISCMYLDVDGVIGLHPATVDQLLLIMEGEGMVTGSEQKETKVSKGEGVFWKAGEWHETKSEKGMTAITIEGKGIDPGTFMKERN